MFRILSQSESLIFRKNCTALSQSELRNFFTYIIKHYKITLFIMLHKITHYIVHLQSTFQYNSTLWENKESFNIEAGQTALDFEETKLPTFWSTSFKELCIGMKVGNDLNFLSFSYPANSLYTLFADSIYRSTNITRGEWKSLLAGSSLQTGCRKQGFNVDSSHFVDVRLGYIGNEQNHCLSTDSYIGIGSNSEKNTWCHFQWSKTNVNIAGNFAGCFADNGNVEITAMAYLLVR